MVVSEKKGELSGTLVYTGKFRGHEGLTFCGPPHDLPPGVSPPEKVVLPRGAER